MRKIANILLIIIGFSCNPEVDIAVVSETDNKPFTRLDTLNEKIVKAPNLADNYYQRALYLYNDKDYERAMADLNRALLLDSLNAEYFFELGNINYDLNDFEKAFENYQKAIEVDDNHVGAYLRLGKINIGLRDYQKALSMLNKALEINPMNPEGYFLKGFVYLDGGDTAKSISSFRTAIEVDPDYYDSYIMLGKLYAIKKHDFAGDYYDQAIRLKPNSIEALYNKSMYLQSVEKYDEAYSLYDKIIELDSVSYFAYYNRGYMMLISDSSYSGAITEFEKSLKFYPYYFQAMYNIGLCYENLGEFKKAEEYYRKALKINPQYDAAAHGLSRLLE